MTRKAIVTGCAVLLMLRGGLCAGGSCEIDPATGWSGYFAWKDGLGRIDDISQTESSYDWAEDHWVCNVPSIGWMTMVTAYDDYAPGDEFSLYVDERPRAWTREYADRDGYYHGECENLLLTAGSHTFSLHLTAGAWMGAARASFSPVVQTPGSPVLAGGSTVEGKTIGQWTGDWWNWAHSFGAGQDPLVDADGSLAVQHQAEPVFFVGGTRSGPAARSFEVPDDKHLLIPLVTITYVRSAGEDPAQIRNTIRQIMDDTTALHFSLDGVPIPEVQLFTHREESGYYTDVIAEGNDYSGEPAGAWTDSFSDGYWLMLEPLPAGTHDIRFGGTVSSAMASWSVDAWCSLDVTSAPAFPLGDANGDCIVDLQDIVLAIAHWQATGDEATWSTGDVTLDQVVNLDDIVMMISHWQEGCPGGSAGAGTAGNAGVPEPATLCLLALGELAAIGRRRRRC